MGRHDDDDVNEDGYDPGDDASDDEAERFRIGADNPIMKD
jgi:hypothetical protein